MEPEATSVGSRLLANGYVMRFGGSRTHTTLAYFAAFTALGLTVGLLGPTLPGLARQTNVTLSAISYVFTARSLGYVCGSLGGGKLLDERRGNSVLGTMLVLMSILMAMIPLASRLWFLLVLMLFLGIAEATLDIGANTLLVWLHGSAVAPYLNALHSLFGVGALTAPIIVAQLVSSGHELTLSYFAVAAVLLPIAIYVYGLPSPKPTGETGPLKSQRHDATLLWLIALFLLLYVGAEIGFAGWVFTYAVEYGLSGPGPAAYLVSFFWGALTLGRLVTVPAAARWAPARMLLLSMAGALLSVLVILLQPVSYAFLLIGTTGLGLSLAPAFPAALAFARSHMNITGRITGLFVLGSSLGAMSVPLLIGQVFRIAGQRFFAFAIFTTLVAALGVLTLMVQVSRPMPATGN